MQIERHAIFWTGALLLFAAMLWLLSGVLMPFAAGMALAYLLDPLADRLQRMGLGRLTASLIILGLCLVLFIVTLVAVVPLLAHQLGGFIEKLPSYISRLQELARTEGGALADRFGFDIFEKLGLGGSGSPPADISRSVGDLVTKAGQFAATFLGSLWSGGQALLGIASLLVITPVVAFYMLVDWDKMISAIDSWVPVNQQATVRELATDINTAIAGFLRGQSLVCLFLGLWYGIGLSLVGLNFGLLIGITAGILSFIPYVGSLTALVVAAAVAIAQGWPSFWLLTMAMIVVGIGQFLEGNILTPRLVGQSVGLHPVWLMFALIAFGSLFGFTGLIIAVPVAAAIGVLARFALRRYLESPYYQGKGTAA